VLVGHVDSQADPAVFYRLTGIRVGDQVTVARADGSLARFAVSAVTEVRKSAFPAADVFAPTDGPSLRLITCTGAFDTTKHHYVDSLIAWASPSP
jgi:sortase (surface protein transpeptidase)